MQQKQKELLASGIDELINNVKILLFKNNPNIFEILDFEDDYIYQEPLLTACFRDKENTNLEDLQTIIYGYTKFELRPEILKIKTDKYGRIYLPNIGWILTDKKEHYLDLIKNKEDQKGLEFKIFSKGNEITFDFESRYILKNSTIELLKYPIPILQQFYHDSNLNLLDVDIEKVSRKHSKNVTIALNLIKNHAPSIYEPITQVTNRISIFYIEPSASGGVKRNSFAMAIGLSIGFFNAYQKEYNEVFFLDDIAHQTGHLVFHALIYDINKYIKVDPNTVLQTFSSETRDLLVVFHALYTYYTTLIVFDAILDAKVFSGHKEHEALGRMLFYLEKCYLDLHLIEKENDYSIELNELFTKDGLEIYHMIKIKFDLIFNKWHPKVKHLNTSSQPYNFTYSEFIKINPILENNI